MVLLNILVPADNKSKMDSLAKKHSQKYLCLGRYHFKQTHPKELLVLFASSTKSKLEDITGAGHR